jgi:hypothetical protein
MSHSSPPATIDEFGQGFDKKCQQGPAETSFATQLTKSRLATLLKSNPNFRQHNVCNSLHSFIDKQPSLTFFYNHSPFITFVQSVGTKVLDRV